MTFETYLRDTTTKLTQADITTARLDVLVLMEDILGTNRAQLLAHPERELSSAEIKKMDTLVARRAEHEPLAYVRGKVEFYGREFIITPAVLVPRPESETMIDMLKALACHPGLRAGIQSKRGAEGTQNRLDSSLRWNDSGVEAGAEQPKMLEKLPIFDKNRENIEVSEKKRLTSKVFSDLSIGDVGAGSGALGITAALELPGSRVELLEIDEAALRVAQRNAAKYVPEMTVIRSDLLAASTLDFDVLLCNLPYVPTAHTINQAAMSEPELAIFGGTDGLDVYRDLFSQIKGLSDKPKLILTESLPPQHADLAVLASEFGYRQLAEDDFIQAFALVS